MSLKRVILNHALVLISPLVQHVRRVLQSIYKNGTEVLGAYLYEKLIVGYKSNVRINRLMFVSRNSSKTSLFYGIDLVASTHASTMVLRHWLWFRKPFAFLPSHNLTNVIRKHMIIENSTWFLVFNSRMFLPSLKVCTRNHREPIRSRDCEVPHMSFERQQLHPIRVYTPRGSNISSTRTYNSKSLPQSFAKFSFREHRKQRGTYLEKVSFHLWNSSS